MIGCHANRSLRCGLNLTDWPRADLESGLGASPRGFESRILRPSQHKKAPPGPPLAARLASCHQRLRLDERCSLAMSQLTQVCV